MRENEKINTNQGKWKAMDFNNYYYEILLISKLLSVGLMWVVKL
jgi:hypothetical protein